MKTCILSIEGMACNHCTASVNTALSAIDGVESVKVSLEEKSATVTYDADKVTLRQLADTIDELGFEVIDA
jgi:copper chaperone